MLGAGALKIVGERLVLEPREQLTGLDPVALFDQQLGTVPATLAFTVTRGSASTVPVA